MSTQLPRSASGTPAASRRISFARARHLRRWLVALIATALALLFVGLAGRAIMREYSDVPPVADLARELALVHDAGAPRGIAAVLIHDHFPALRAAKQMVVAFNGQIDNRLFLLGSLLLVAVVLALLLLALRWTLGVTCLALLALGGVVALLLPASADVPPQADTFGVAIALLFSLLHVHGARRSLPGSGTWWWAHGCGAVAIASATLGLAGPAALLAVTIVVGPRSILPSARRSWTLVANAVLVVCGLGLAAARTIHAEAVPGGWTALSWPFGTPFAGLILWLPALGCIASARSGAGRRPAQTLAVYALWVATLVLILAATGEVSAATSAVMFFALLINAACWAGVRIDSRRGRTTRIFLAALWCIAIGVALLHPDGRRPHPRTATATQRVALAEAIRANATESLHDLDPADRAAASRIVAIARHSNVLPVSVRRVLPISPGPDASAVFRRDGAVLLEERESLPVLGTWSIGGTPRSGEYVSEAVTTSFPAVQMRIGGELRPPVRSIVLRTASGHEVVPLTHTILGRERWRRINFVAPAEPFRVVARSADAKDWLAFTAPVEVGAITRFAGKIPPAWPQAALWAGLLLAAGLAAMVLAHAQRPAGLPPPRDALPMQALPWFALFAYALFFAHHLDPTAGPNDSGGYLNSAKLMVGGHVTAAPRMIFGASAGETDVTPYLPITFHANGSRMVPEYPVGWPLEVALFGAIFGLRFGLPLLMVAQLVLGVVLTQRLGRAFGLNRGWAWLGAGIVALSPVYLFEALQPVSDGPALVWVTASIYWAWLARERPGYAYLSGAATALAVMIRPSDLLGVAPVLVCLAGHWRQLARWAVAGLPGALWLAWYHQTLYGNWHTTGYGDYSSGFALRFLPLTARSYALWLPELLTPLVILAVGLPWLRRVPARSRWVLAVWIGIFIAFYAVYWCTWDNWYNMRFLLPAFPALVVAMLLVASTIASRFHLDLFAAPASRRATLVSATLVATLLGFLTLRTAERQVTYWMGSNHKPRIASEWARDHLPANAVVFAKHLTGSLFYYTDLTFVRLDYPPAQESNALYDRIRQTRRPIYAMTCHWETRNYRWESGHNGSGYPDLPGTWERVAALCDNDILVWRRKE